MNCMRFVSAVTLLLGVATASLAVEIASTDFGDGGDGTIAGDTSGSGWAADGWAVQDAALGGAIVPSEMSYTVPGGGTVTATHALQFTGSPLGAGVQRALAEPVNGDDVFISFLTKWESGVIDGNDFVIWYFNNNGGPNIGYKANEGSGDEGPDFVARTAGNTNQYAPDELVIGDTYFVVGHLSKSTPGAANPYDTYSLYVNPSYGDFGTPESVSMGASNISEFTNVGVRSHQINAGGAEPDDLRFAALRIGTAWSDVVPVPEPVSGITALIGVVSLLGLRRRRYAS